MDKILTSYSIPHVIHNNLYNLIKSRYGSSETPSSYPSNFSNVRSKNKEDIEIEKNIFNQSCNLNIILNTTAIVENSLELILVSPLDKSKENISDFMQASVSVLKAEIIKISSLDRYFDYYKKIYQVRIKEIITSEELNGVNLLFELRNLIIHCSALSAVWVEEDSRSYLFVEDTFYLDILKKVIKIMDIADRDFYCLPESLLGWNELIDSLVINAHKVVVKITQRSKVLFPALEIPLFYYGIGDFIKFGQIGEKSHLTS